MNDQTAVIVLNWNGLADTRECLASLFRITGASFRAYVVDNGSTDGSAEVLQSEFGERITLIANPENLLYAGGNNVGIRRALADGCAHLLLLNNDTIVDERLLAELVAASKRWDSAVLCPKIYFASPPNMLWYAGGRLNLKRALFVHRGHCELDRGQYDTEEPTGWATGCALFAPRQVFENVGLLDESLGLYNEDVDFCLRARTQGYATAYVPSGVVWHKVSASVGGVRSLRKLRLKWTSLLRMLRRHIPKRRERFGALAGFMVREAPRLVWHLTFRRFD
ncbi:glycosyltransferase family 2 protein [bacterium]|nr:glycosyltransferase family 2 protein [bacterium]MBU1983267.1 glycosyltransferase family 2 protein [bacterium]